MLEFLVDDILLVFAENVFQQTAGIKMETDCVSLLAIDIILYSYKTTLLPFFHGGGLTSIITAYTDVRLNWGILLRPPSI